MIILGIDPALVNVGWGVICYNNAQLKYVASGVINTNANIALHYRLAAIANKIEQVIVEYKPDIVALEETFINTNAISSLKLGYARGAIMSVIGKLDLEMREFKPNMIKKTITGRGHADKQQIVRMVKTLFPDIVHLTRFDEADALAIAYACYAYSSS